MEQLLDAAPDAFVIIDDTGVIRLVNRQAEVLFGYRRDEMVGHLVETLIPESIRPIHPTHRSRYFAHPASRPMGAGLELTARRKDGSEFPVDISLSSLKTAQGLLVSAAVRDITERKRNETERATLESQLLQAQRDEERAVLEAQLHQAQRLESVGQLAGGIAHDFNNLLAAIMNYAALVADGIQDVAARHGLDDESIETLRADVGEITSVAKRAAQLTYQLLIFSRRDVVKPEVLDLNAVVTDMERLLRRTLGESVDLHVGLGGGLRRTRMDRGQLEQVLMNLAVNARDAMPRGGRLQIETANFDIDADYARQHQAMASGPYVRLTVSDTGSGMPAAVAARAFEPFFTTKGTGQGSGLGLATVYGIVTQSGGDIVIYSEPGLGTTIRVNLPATDALAQPLHYEEAAAGGQPGGGTILLVEDEDMVREPARRILQRNGYSVLTASNADEAMRVAAENPGTIDLLLTDVIMPGKSGKELAAALLELRPDVRVLYMSGYSQDVIVHQGVLEAGVNLVEKPFAAADLLRRVREVLDAP